MEALAVKIGVLAIMLFVAIFVFGAEKHGDWLEKTWANALAGVAIFVAATIVPYTLIKCCGKVNLARY